MAALNLDVLFDYLDGEQNEFGLDFAATHGFLCATVVGPALKDWLTHLFDGSEKKIPAHVIEQIHLWQQEILQTLSNEDTIELPFEIEEADVESSLGDWSILPSQFRFNARCGLHFWCCRGFWGVCLGYLPGETASKN